MEDYNYLVNKVNFKLLLSSVIAGSAILTLGNPSSVNASGACANAPRGEKLIRTGPNSWKMYATVRQSMKSKNEEEVEFGFQRLELRAQRSLAQFVNRTIKNYNKLDENKKREFVVNDGEQTGSLSGIQEIVDQINANTDAILVGSQEIGRCHEPGVQIMLTRGINSENVSTASNITSPNSNKSGNDTQKDNYYRNDVNQGYSGYGNWEDF